MLLGVDTGGTFTDFVLLDGDSMRVHKVLSTPHAPEEAILQGIRELGIDCDRLRIIHGSTVATNAVLEGKGARTAFVTNRGFKDLLTIGRQARKELYNLQPAPEPPPVSEELCFETGGRLSASGEWLDPLGKEDIARLVAEIEAAEPEAVAINLLFSFLDESAEQSIEQAIPDRFFVSRSSSVLPEYKEYERGIATWLNSYTGPKVEGYLDCLCQGVEAESVSVMQSSGGTIDAGQAAKLSVNMLLSGPAGGLVGALRIGQLAGESRLLTFDMGGTSTDVSLIDGEVPLTSEGNIAGYPVAVPMVDMHTIGAGGGSIASVDKAGLLCVGPESAGALPGPACYRKGGLNATVTDANVVLGRLPANSFLGGSMSLDHAAACCAVDKIASALGLDREEAAAGIIKVANEHMARALRVMSVQRGYDPREFRLVSFGGAGGLHVCALAEALEMEKAMVPVHGGVLSAFGMLAAPRSRQFSRTLTGLLGEIDSEEIERLFRGMEKEGRRELEKEGVAPEVIRLERSFDVRYRGQSYTLRVPVGPVSQVEAEFHQRHQLRYGHALELPVELVNLRLSVRGDMPQPRLVDLPEREEKAELEPAVYIREKLAVGRRISGPAVIVETVATTYLEEGWCCVVDRVGNLMLERIR